MRKITFDKWFKANKVSAALSHAGTATQQIIQTLGGCWGVGCLAHRGVIELFDEMTRSIAKTTHYRKFKNKIRNAISYEGLKDRTVEKLVEEGAVELGLELKCSQCNSWSWYSVKQLDYSLTCDLCRKEFGFPITEPANSVHSRWAYRVVGPFALPDYASGGYAAALAIRFFVSVVGETGGAEAIWLSGQELELPTGKKLESDFILWHQRKNVFGLDFPTETLFGEAKSFGGGAFKQDDVDRMKSLAETFPGSILVFAAMKEGEDFSKEEIERLKKLAEWGREYDREREQSRAPVIILTGTELFTEYSLEESWEGKGGTHKDLIGPARGRTHNLRVLADLTQQLYLGMPSYDSYRRNEMQKLEWSERRLI